MAIWNILQMKNKVMLYGLEIAIYSDKNTIYKCWFEREQWEEEEQIHLQCC